MRALPLIIGANLAVFAWMVVATGTTDWPALTLFRWGGNYGVAVFAAGQWWRLLTSQYLHAGPTHILGNMLLLFYAGRPVEWLIGPIAFAVCYTISGLVAGLFSAVGNPQVVAVGASGAIAGVVGMLIVFYLRGRTPGVSGQWVLQTVGLNVGLSFLPSVDWLAHVGGLLAGFVCGAALLARVRRPLAGP